MSTFPPLQNQLSRDREEPPTLEPPALAPRVTIPGLPEREEWELQAPEPEPPAAGALTGSIPET